MVKSVTLLSCLLLHLHISAPSFVSPEVKVNQISQECQVSYKVPICLDQEVGSESHQSPELRKQRKVREKKTKRIR